LANDKRLAQRGQQRLRHRVLGPGVVAQLQPRETQQVGIAKAGQNDCASLSGSHSCAGQSKADMDKGEWKYVAKGSCKDMKGMSMDEAKAALKKS
jgi:uncharacterized membrane protein